MRRWAGEPLIKKLSGPAILAFASLVVLFCAQATRAEQIGVKYPEGTTHGFLVLRSTDGKRIAGGDVIETVQGGNIKSELTFHFDDGSMYDETEVFSQDKHFQLLDYHLVMKGPAFKQPMEVKMDAAHGEVSVHYADSHGKQKTLAKKMQIPPDVANGLTTVFVRNIAPNSGPVTVPYLATTPKPMLVNLVITPEPGGKIPVDGTQRETIRYAVKVHVGGVTGALAKIFGKEPPTSSIWMLRGEVPTFLKAELPLGGSEPMRTIDLVAPTENTAAK